MQLQIVECSADADPSDLTRLALKSNPRQIGFVHLQRKSDTQLEPDYWLIGFFDHNCNPIGHLSFQTNSPLEGSGLEEIVDDTVFIVMAHNMSEFETLCRANNLQIVRVIE